MSVEFRFALVTSVLAMISLERRTCVSGARNITSGVAKHIRSIGFPEGSNTGIFFAIGVPVDLEAKSVQFSMYFEANYGLPAEWNSTYDYDEAGYQRRGLNRQIAYEILMNKLNTYGYSGEACLSKMICEFAKEPFTSNGVLEDVLHVLFTPSSSRGEELPDQFTEAEHVDDCEATYQDCPVTPFNLISHYVTQHRG